MPRTARAFVTVALAAASAGLVSGSVGVGSLAHAQAADSDLADELAAVAALAGQPRVVSAAGLTRDQTPLLTVENPSPFDVPGAERRVVMVGGLDGNPDSARLVLDAVRWFKTAAPEQLRTRWALSALPLANPTAQPVDTFPPDGGYFDDPERPDSRYVWRWVAYQAPDLVVEVRAGGELRIQSSADAGTRSDFLPSGSLAVALADPTTNGELGTVDTMLVTAPASDGATMLRDVLARAAGGASPLRATIAERVTRQPLSVARVLAERYPETPGVGYVQAVAWVHTLRLAALTDDASLRAKVLREVRPWLVGEQSWFGDQIRFTAVGGAMVFAELALAAGEHQAAAVRLAADGIVHAAAETAPGVPQYGFGWTEDVFLGTATAATAADPNGLDAAARLIVQSASQLQRSDGLFHHSSDAQIPWGRGNGFAALGLAETLTALSPSHPQRDTILDVYRRLMRAMRSQQAPDGTWRQVVNLPGTYREATVTAMTVTAMARGVRLGWLDDTYRPLVMRGWRGLLAHVVDDGALVDACISTGAGPTLRHYLDRVAVNGADDRGGAFALGAALEIDALVEGR